MAKPLTLSAPWHTYQKMMTEFFSYDDTVTVGALEENEEGEYRLPR